MEKDTVMEQLSTEVDPSMSIKSRLRSARSQKAQSDGQQTPIPQMMAAADEIPAELPVPTTPVPWPRESEATPETITSSNNKRQQEKTYESTEAEDMMRRSYMSAVEERDKDREEFEQQVSARIRRLKEGLTSETVSQAPRIEERHSEPEDAAVYRRCGDDYYKIETQPDGTQRRTKMDVWEVPWPVLKKYGIPGDLRSTPTENQGQGATKKQPRRDDNLREPIRDGRRPATSLFKPVNQGRDDLVPELDLLENDGGGENRRSGRETNWKASEAALRDELNNTLVEFCGQMKNEFQKMMNLERQNWIDERKREMEDAKRRKTADTNGEERGTSESASVTSLYKEMEQIKQMMMQQAQPEVVTRESEERRERLKLQHEVEQLKRKLEKQSNSGNEKTSAPTEVVASGSSSTSTMVQPFAHKVKLPKFDGKNYYSFISIFETNAKLRAWNNEEKLAWFLPCIEGEARLYLETEPDEMLSYERVKRSMEERYGNRYSTFDVKRQIRTLKRQAGETIESFADRLQSVSQNGKIDKTDKCELFYRAFLDAVEDEPKLQMYIEKEHDKNRQARLPDLLKMVREYRERSPERTTRSKAVNVCQSIDKRKGPLKHEDPSVRGEIEKETQKIKEEKVGRTERSDRILRNDVDYNTGEVEFLKRVIKANGLHHDLKEKEAKNKEKTFQEPMGEPMNEENWQRIRAQQREGRNRGFQRPHGGFRRRQYVGMHEGEEEGYTSEEEGGVSRDDAHAGSE